MRTIILVIVDAPTLQSIIVKTILTEPRHNDHFPSVLEQHPTKLSRPPDWRMHPRIPSFQNVALFRRPMLCADFTHQAMIKTMAHISSDPTNGRSARAPGKFLARRWSCQRATLAMADGSVLEQRFDIKKLGYQFSAPQSETNREEGRMLPNPYCFNVYEVP